MAANSITGQSNPWDQLLAYFGQGDSGTTGDYMTVPTALNTSNNWSPGAAVTQQVGNNGAGTGLGFNVGTGSLALQGLGALAGIWSSAQQNKLAKEQFDFQKEFAQTNLANQVKTYNTALEDRLNARGAMEGRSSEYTADEIARRRLSS